MTDETRVSLNAQAEFELARAAGFDTWFEDLKRKAAADPDGEYE